MTIDSSGRMWVIDVGRRNFYDKDSSLAVDGPAGLFVLDIASRQQLSYYQFPDSVVQFNSSFLNDIVLDESKDDDVCVSV